MNVSHSCVRTLVWVWTVEGCWKGWKCHFIRPQERSMGHWSQLKLNTVHLKELGKKASLMCKIYIQLSFCTGETLPFLFIPDFIRQEEEEETLPCRIKLEPSNLRLFCPHYRVNKIGAPLLRPCSLLPSIIYSEGVLFISMLLLFGASIWYLNAHQQIFPFQILVRVLERQRVMRTWNKSIHLNQPRRLNSCDGAILLMIQITLLLPLFKCDCH